MPNIVEIKTHWETQLVALSVLIAIFGSYIALDFAGRMKSVQGLNRALWGMGSALMMGLAIWTMHFVGMMALMMPMPVAYDERLVVLSILAAIAGSGIAFAIMNRPTLNWSHVIAGSIAMGLAIFVMHYTGMASMQMHVWIRYEPVLFILSVIIAIIASAAALWITFRLKRQESDVWFWQKLVSAVVMGFAVSGMHYTGMAAAHYFHMENTIPGMNIVPTVGTFKLSDLLITASILFGLTLLLLSALLTSERQAALDSAQESEKRFLATFEQVATGMALVGLQGEWLKLNQKYCEILGYYPGELLGMTFQATTYPADLEVEMKLYQKLLAGGINFYKLEKRHIRKDGVPVWVDLTVSLIRELGKPLYTVVVAEDISERKKAQEDLYQLNEELEQRVRERVEELEVLNAELLLNEERFRLIVESVKDYAIMMLSPDGTILTWNKGAIQIMGYTPEEIIGQPFTKFYPPEAIQSRWPNHELKIAKEQGRFEDEGWRVRKDGSRFCANVILTALYDSKGSLIGFAKITRDLTEQKKAQEELQASEQKYRELSETLQFQSTQLGTLNKELEAFCYSVSHDLRAPLRGIDGFSQILLEQYNNQLDEQGQHYLSRVRQGSQQMGKLIDDMLQLSRLTRGEMSIQPVNLSELAKEITHDLQEREPERHVEFVIADDLMVNGDEHLLQAAIQNLLDNAWKYTSKHAQAHIEFGVKNNGQPTYFVRDDGAGFDMKYAGKLFGAFQRLHGNAEFPGTGVGLATVARIIHRHGGEIWTQAEIEKGATFYFTLSNTSRKPMEKNSDDTAKQGHFVS